MKQNIHELNNATNQQQISSTVHEFVSNAPNSARWTIRKFSETKKDSVWTIYVGEQPYPSDKDILRFCRNERMFVGGGRKASSLQARDYLDRIEKETLREIPKNKHETPRVILSDNALQILIKQKRLVKTNDNSDTYVPTMAMYN